MANTKIINICVHEVSSTYTVRDVIRQGDIKAYYLNINLTNIKVTSSTVEFRFVLPDGQYLDREVTVTGNKIIYEMQPEEYSQLGELKCYIRFIQDNLFTPVLLIFTGIQPVEGNVEFTGEIISYPEWISDAKRIVESFVESATFEHNQTIADTRWQISHGLGYYPSVTAMDSTGTVILGDVRHFDENNLIVEFAHPEAGKASLT